MLGVQETRSAGSPKTYSCVACSATFHSLSSLLVHQASHASEASHQPESTLPTCVSCGSLFVSKDLLEKHHCVTLPSPVITFVCDCGEEFSDCIAFEDHKIQHDSENIEQLDLERSSVVPESKMPTCVSCGNLFATMDLLEKHQCVRLPTPESPASRAHLHTCDCGKEFGDFTTLEEHKKQHDTENKMDLSFEKIPVIPEKKTDLIRLISDQVFHSLSPLAFNEKQLAPIPPSTSDSITKTIESTTDMESKILQSSELHFVNEEQVQTLEEDNDTLNSSTALNHSLHDNEKSPESSKESDAVDSGLMDQDSGEKKKSILKILASAYMSHKQPVQMKQRNLPPRKVSPRAPIQPPPTVIISKPEPPKIQSTPSKETMSVQPGKMFSKKGKIIPVTQTLCPVVVLETRQKLFGRDNVEGRHQCRLCRRVFQDLDTLIMHHALHKKERVKFCLYCQQFVITVISVPENHVCFSSFSKNIQPLTAKMPPEPVIPTAQQLEKIFYCSLCKRGYARIRSLKRHNCPCKAPLKSASPTVNRVELKPHTLDSSTTAMQISKNNQMSSHHVNIGVGTEPIKVEEHHTEFPIDKKNQIHPPKPLEHSSKPTESAINSVKLPENMASMKEEEEKEKLDEKQWTMPLDDAEIDTLVDGEQKDSDEDDLADMDEDDCYEEDDVNVESSEEMEIDSESLSEGYQVFITNKGVKRYVCIECQRSYSRQFTLKEHLKVCEARILKEQTIENKIADLPGPIKKFPCPQCGKFFSRKDNMNMHQKKCHGKTAVPAVVSTRTEPKTPVAQENLFVLSPSTENKAVQQETPQNTSSSRNWGIMSLPSVLPRKVTCECGASFTCPRLLFEHLQQHAQESYICPHCGESLQSWMDFEAHQQLHKQSQSSNEQRGPQQRPHTFSQALPLHAPTRPPQSPGFSEHKPPALLPPKHLNNGPDTAPLTCPRCKKNFSQRSSLARHIRLRCTGDPTTQKKHPCTRCGATFLNPLNLKIHVQSNTCKPAFKPIRCPVCVRWFSCLDGLKRHLVSHSRQAVCQICDQNCPNLQALEEHKRKVHGLNNRLRPEENAPNLSSQPSVENTSVTPFQCHVCLRYYPKLQSLKDHLRKVHRPKQPKQNNLSTTEPVRIGQFLCQICGRSYPTIKSLKNHRRRVHNILGAVFPPMKGPEQNSAPGQFQCHICSRSYPDIQSLRNHRRRVHGIVGGLDVSKGVTQHNLYKCLICQRSYPDEISLKNHRRRVHRILGPVPEPSVSTIATNDIEEDLDQKPIPFL